MLTTGNGAAETPCAIHAWRGGRLIRDLAGLPETLARAGKFELKFAVTRKEIRAVQKMRYRVFFEEGGANADPLARARRLDDCPFDRLCDHLVVVDHAFVTRRCRIKPRVVGAYRLLRQDAVAGAEGFYASAEFEIGRVIARHPGKRFLELGRSCVLPEYRAHRVLELLWRGLWAYVRHHRIDVMFGCASLPGADPGAHAPALAFLRAHALAGEDWRAPARASSTAQLRVSALKAPDGLATADLAGREEARRALAMLPPLVKGYLKLGATFGDEVFVDHAFNTTDVLVMLPVERIEPRYIEHFSGGPIERAA